MKKTLITFDSIFFEKNIILKNSIKFAFYKKLKFSEKKNKFLNYFFYSFFLKNYKKNNLKIYLNYFSNNNLNKFFVFSKNNFKNQFFYNVNDLKLFCDNEKFQFLFLKKKNNLNYFFNNCILINSLNTDKINNNDNFLDNFYLLDLNLKSTYIDYNNLIYFINFNIYIFNILEFYKILTLLFFLNLNFNKLIKKFI